MSGAGAVIVSTAALALSGCGSSGGQPGNDTLATYGDASPESARPQCPDPQSYWIGQEFTEPGREDVREAARRWNYAVGREVLRDQGAAEVDGRGTVHVLRGEIACEQFLQTIGEDPSPETDIVGLTDENGVIWLCNSRSGGNQEAFIGSIAHEFGHLLLGMVHLTNPAALLYWTPSVTVPTEVDVAAVNGAQGC
jgi:hypothetical protein